MLNACYFCDGVFAEVVDLAFIDALLPGHREDSLGYSLVINRNPRFKEFWDQELSSNNLNLNRIDLEQIVSSQCTQLLDKCEAMQYRCSMAHKDGKIYPKNRWPLMITGNF